MNGFHQVHRVVDWSVLGDVLCSILTLSQHTLLLTLQYVSLIGLESLLVILK